MPRAKRVLAAVAVALAAAPAAQAAERRVLLVSEVRGFVHDQIPAATEFFARLGERGRACALIPLGGAAELTPRRLRRADRVVFANTSGELELSDRPAFRRFVRSAGAFIGTHSASDTLHSWAAFETLLGGEFLRHGPVQPGQLAVARRPHPVTRGLPRSFVLTDEFYEFRAPPPPRTRVLVRLGDLPLVWARRYGAGRVFYSALGHPPEVWSEPLHRRILTRGAAWALTR